MARINECVFEVVEQDEEGTYEENEHEFDTDYARENPVLKKHALSEWM
jgi:hypothetical protein